LSVKIYIRRDDFTFSRAHVSKSGAMTGRNNNKQSSVERTIIPVDKNLADCNATGAGATAAARLPEPVEDVAVSSFCRRIGRQGWTVVVDDVMKPVYVSNN
jgi:hypothetical protein